MLAGDDDGDLGLSDILQRAASTSRPWLKLTGNRGRLFTLSARSLVTDSR